MAKKHCPKCGRQYEELANYCTRCGLELEQAPNRCSENKTALCARSVLEDADTFCPYCGSLTVYALERTRENK